jgi:hypothetical protein
VLPSAAPLPQPLSIPSNAPRCRYPAKLPTPAWYPSDLPLPGGTYASQLLPGAQGYFRAVFVVPGNLPDLVRFILREWPNKQNRWQLGRGDAEANEAEAPFQKPPAAGAFKAQGKFCSPGYSLMLIIYAPDRTQVSGAGTQPQSPLAPTPSPSASL